MVSDFKQILNGASVGSTQFFNSFKGDKKSAQRAIEQSIKVKSIIANSCFVCKGLEFISLGFNCSTAHYLREIGLRTSAYPFDWVFSSTAIVADAVRDSCQNFLDRSQYKQHEIVSNISHLRYHEYFFAHKNPLSNDVDYQYYQRACERFNRVFAERIPACFVVTLITEPEKRPGWSKGFNRSFSGLGAQNVAAVRSLQECLTTVHPNISFVVIEHYTETEFDVSIEHVASNLIHIRFCAEGKSTGKVYADTIDDLCFKIVLAGLISS